MKVSLTDRQKLILNKVFKERDASGWIKAIQTASLGILEIEEACVLLSGEFHMNGIDENYEATDYGREVEALLDIVNRPRLM